MLPFREYIAQQFLNKRFRFVCHCLMALDVVGTVLEYELLEAEIIFHVQTDSGKIIRIGSNHPTLQIEEIK